MPRWRFRVRLGNIGPRVLISKCLGVLLYLNVWSGDEWQDDLLANGGWRSEREKKTRQREIFRRRGGDLFRGESM